LEKAVSLQPGSAAAQSNLGAVHLKAGQVGAAIEHFDAASTVPHSATCHCTAPQYVFIYF
jgi:hypothetical protein